MRLLGYGQRQQLHSFGQSIRAGEKNALMVSVSVYELVFVDGVGGEK
jgi:hypothetical protein